MSEISRKSVDTMRKVGSESSYFAYGFTSLVLTPPFNFRFADQTPASKERAPGPIEDLVQAAHGQAGGLQVDRGPCSGCTRPGWGTAGR